MLTTNWDRKKRDTPWAASARAWIVRLTSVWPPSRIKRSRSDSCSSDMNISSTSTRPASPIGPQASENSRVRAAVVVRRGARISTGIGWVGLMVMVVMPRLPVAGTDPCGATAVSSASMRANGRSVISRTAATLVRIAARYFGRSLVTATSWKASTMPTPTRQVVASSTDSSVAGSCDRPARRMLRISGAITRLRMDARAIGSRTSRPTYSRPRPQVTVTSEPAFRCLNRERSRIRVLRAE